MRIFFPFTYRDRGSSAKYKPGTRTKRERDLMTISEIRPRVRNKGKQRTPTLVINTKEDSFSFLQLPLTYYRRNEFTYAK